MNYYRILRPRICEDSSQQKSSAFFVVCSNVYEASLANSVDQDQTAPIARCLLLYLIRQ